MRYQWGFFSLYLVSSKLITENSFIHHRQTNHHRQPTVASGLSTMPSLPPPVLVLIMSLRSLLLSCSWFVSCREATGRCGAVTLISVKQFAIFFCVCVYVFVCVCVHYNHLPSACACFFGQCISIGHHAQSDIALLL